MIINRARKLIIVDYPNSKVIAEFPAHHTVEECWEAPSDDILVQEWYRLIAVETEQRAVSLMTNYGNRARDWPPSLELPTTQDTEKVVQILSKFRGHSILIFGRYGNIEILIGRPEPDLLRDFVVHYDDKKIFNRLVFVANNSIIQEIPRPAHGNRRL
jgi:hypothetical protein